MKPLSFLTRSKKHPLQNVFSTGTNGADQWIADRPETLRKISDLESKVVQLSQYIDVLTSENRDIAPLPPKHLQERVVGVYSPHFVTSGDTTYRTLASLLATIGRSFAEFRTVLDFGCGCGRIIRAMKRNEPGIAFHGADIDAEAIAWLRDNYSRIGEFRALPHRPRTSYDDDSFDFIYGISVFTHLPEDMQFEWLAELSRIAKPGAAILLTTHGEKHWGRFTGAEAKVMKSKGFYYRHAASTAGLPDFYKNTYHSHGYIRENWSKHMTITSIVELGIDNHQDVVLACAPEK